MDGDFWAELVAPAFRQLRVLKIDWKAIHKLLATSRLWFEQAMHDDSYFVPAGAFQSWQEGYCVWKKGVRPLDRLQFTFGGVEVKDQLQGLSSGDIEA